MYSKVQKMMNLEKFLSKYFRSEIIDCRRCFFFFAFINNIALNIHMLTSFIYFVLFLWSYPLLNKKCTSNNKSQIFQLFP